MLEVLYNLFVLISFIISVNFMRDFFQKINIKILSKSLSVNIVNLNKNCLFCYCTNNLIKINSENNNNKKNDYNNVWVCRTILKKKLNFFYKNRLNSINNNNKKNLSKIIKKINKCIDKIKNNNDYNKFINYYLLSTFQRVLFLSSRCVYRNRTRSFCYHCHHQFCVKKEVINFKKQQSTVNRIIMGQNQSKTITTNEAGQLEETFDTKLTQRRISDNRFSFFLPFGKKLDGEICDTSEKKEQKLKNRLSFSEKIETPIYEKYIQLEPNITNSSIVNEPYTRRDSFRLDNNCDIKKLDNDNNETIEKFLFCKEKGVSNLCWKFDANNDHNNICGDKDYFSKNGTKNEIDSKRSVPKILSSTTDFNEYSKINKKLSPELSPQKLETTIIPEIRNKTLENVKITEFRDSSFSSDRDSYYSAMGYDDHIFCFSELPSPILSSTINEEYDVPHSVIRDLLPENNSDEEESNEEIQKITPRQRIIPLMIGNGIDINKVHVENSDDSFKMPMRMITFQKNPKEEKIAFDKQKQEYIATHDFLSPTLIQSSSENAFKFPDNIELIKRQSLESILTQKEHEVISAVSSDIECNLNSKMSQEINENLVQIKENVKISVLIEPKLSAISKRFVKNEETNSIATNPKLGCQFPNIKSLLRNWENSNDKSKSISTDRLNLTSPASSKNDGVELRKKDLTNQSEFRSMDSLMVWNKKTKKMELNDLKDLVIKKSFNPVNNIDEIIRDEVFSKRFSEYSISDLLDDFSDSNLTIVENDNIDILNI